MSDHTWNRAVSVCEWCATALVGIAIGLGVLFGCWLLTVVLAAAGEVLR